MVLTSIFTLENHRKAGVGNFPDQSFLFFLFIKKIAGYYLTKENTRMT